MSPPRGARISAPRWPRAASAASVLAGAYAERAADACACAVSARRAGGLVSKACVPGACAHLDLGQLCLEHTSPFQRRCLALRQTPSGAAKGVVKKPWARDAHGGQLRCLVEARKNTPVAVYIGARVARRRRAPSCATRVRCGGGGREGVDLRSHPSRACAPALRAPPAGKKHAAPPGTVLGNEFCVKLPNGGGVTVPALTCLARLANHSCDPTCTMMAFSVDADGKDHMCVLVTKGRQPRVPFGWEITFSYNWLEPRGVPAPCSCRSENCCGRLGCAPHFKRA